MAVTLTGRDLADLLAGGAEALQQDEVVSAGKVLTFATELMSKYLGAAYDGCPETVCNNVVIRVAGWLREAPAVSSRILVSTRGQGRPEHGQRAVEYGFQHEVAPELANANPLRASGGMALLSPYKRRRALG